MPSAQTIRAGSVRVKLFANRTRVPARGDRPERIYTRHEIRWVDHHHKRHRLKLSNLAEARAEAARIAADLARGHHHAELSLADLASFRAGVNNLFGTSKTIELATSEYAEAIRLLKADKCDDSLQTAVAGYLAARRRPITTLTVAECVQRFVDNKTAQGVSLRWKATLRGQLNRFAADHKRPMAKVSASDVQHWYLNLDDSSARTRNNHLAAVQGLFNDPELRYHPERQAVLDLQPIQHLTAANALWSPEEFRRLLMAAPSHLVPLLVLGGFGKLRASEIQRLAWSDIKLKESRVLLQAGQTKTKRWRAAPLPKAAVAWLRRVKGQGKVWPWQSQKFNADLRALATGCKLSWKPNALRNSAVTYDQTLNPDLARVAREAGNSPAILEREYMALHGVTKATAEKWFKIYPPRPAKRSERKIVKLKVNG